MLFWAMYLNFYDVMKKTICFSTIVSLIFPLIQSVLIYVTMMKYDLIYFWWCYIKKKYFWDAIKKQQKNLNKIYMYLHGLQASIY